MEYILVLLLIVFVLMVVDDNIYNNTKNEIERRRELPKDNETVRHKVRVRKEVSTPRGPDSRAMPAVQNPEPHKVDIDRY